jgi:hypothetical protein
MEVYTVGYVENGLGFPIAPRPAATASLVAVRLSPEKVEELLNALALLRDEAEGYNLQEGQGRRFNLFLAGWGGE